MPQHWFSLVRAEDTQDWQETLIKWWRMLPGEGFLWQISFPTVPSHKSYFGERGWISLHLADDLPWLFPQLLWFWAVLELLHSHWGLCFCCHGTRGGFMPVSQAVTSQGVAGDQTVQDQREGHSTTRIRTGTVTRGHNSCSRDSDTPGTAKRIQLLKVLEIPHLSLKTQP